MYCGDNPVMRVDSSGCAWWNPFSWDWKKIIEGAGLILTAVTAIVVGIATLPFGGGIAIIAGITIVAGVGTAAFGLAEIGEGVTTFNIIRDTIFHGNQSSYNNALNIFKYTAIVGTIICGVYGATHTKISFDRSTNRLGIKNSAAYNTQSGVLTYYDSNGQMKYSMGLFEDKHQWIHWHTEMPHSEPINNILKFIWEVIKGGFGK